MGRQGLIQQHEVGTLSRKELAGKLIKWKMQEMGKEMFVEAWIAVFA
jgi:hypothetical protein